MKKICRLLILLAAPLAAQTSHAVILHISQQGIDDITGQSVSFSGYVDTQAVLESSFETVLRNGETFIDPLFSVGLSHIRIDLGSQIIEQATGSWRMFGDLASPATYDGGSTFYAGDYLWTANEWRIDGPITQAEFMSWEDPIAGLLMSHTVRSLDGRIFSPDMTRLSRLVFGQVSNLSVTVVPTPGTLALFASGLLGMGLIRRRQRAGTGQDGAERQWRTIA